MEFVSIGYLCFLAAVLAGFRLIPLRWRTHLLLVASYAFYCTWSVRMAAVLLLATTVCFLAALQLESLRGRRSASILTFVAVAALVVFLAFFKIRPLLCATCNPIIPLGVSYYTFRLISYLLDVYWGKQNAVREFIPFATYVAFFPQLIAGPIQRESSFLPQLESAHQRDRKILEGSLRMAIGFAKKCVVADNLGLFVGWAYSHLHSGSALPSLVALYLYPLQLYADFSGLVDIAIGSGLMLGLEAPENFDLPFSAKNITEFWRRWHMTLTSWLRDYVFMPIRMLTRDWGEFSLCLSLTVNMLLIALWHGFTLGFFVYGLFHSVFLIAEVLTASRRKQRYSSNPDIERLANFLGPIYVFHVVAVGSVFFRAPSLNSVAQLFASLGSGIHQIVTDFGALVAPPNHNAWIAFPVYLLISAVDAYRRRNGFQLPVLAPRYLKWSVYGIVAATWILIGFVLLGSEKGSDPFVYALF
jgi:alginate O-acetyltransferase complex protein AlgI